MSELKLYLAILLVWLMLLFGVAIAPQSWRDRIWNRLMATVEWVSKTLLMPFERYLYHGSHRINEGGYYARQRQHVREVLARA